MTGWLMKAEPDDYSWDQLVADRETLWTGVRNHQAAANLRAMRPGDPVLFYRSAVDPAVLGLMRVSRGADRDPTDPTGRFVAVEVRPDRPLRREIPLKAIKADSRLADLALVRHSRLSVVPVSAAHWAIVLAMGGLDG